MSQPLCIKVEVPLCAFRPHASREYQDTFPVPSPSSVYGMLLSFLGVRRELMDQHSGSAMALAFEGPAGCSKVFRKLRRGEELDDTRPDYQDVLVDLRAWIWIDRGSDIATPPLVDRLRAALARPQSIDRFGGLSLGESSYLVDTISVSATTPDTLRFLVPDDDGFYSLPVWVDHANSENTILRRFRVDAKAQRVESRLQACWFHIGAATA